MAIIHMVLQGKGGVGKSLAAGLLAQFFMEQDRTVRCIDTDPVNATLAGYPAFNATALNIMNGDDVDPRRFDELIEIILSATPETHLVIDNGAATFLPFCSYLADNAVFDLLTGSDHHVHLHTVVTGGQAMLDTLSGLKSLLRSFAGLPLVVWLNPFFGPISRDGKSFEEFALFKESEQAISAILRLPDRRKDTFGKDLEQMLSDRKTFAEADMAPEYTIMARQRLRMLWRDIRDELGRATL